LISPPDARKIEPDMSDSLDRLYASVVAARGRDPSTSRTAKLFRDGVQKMAKKLIEEAIEVGLDAVQMNREAAILESADVLYQLAVVWAECGISPRRRARRDRPPRARLRHRREIAERGQRGASAAAARRRRAPQGARLTTARSAATNGNCA
jgi:phosphoribosyl-ATP pyrophosphohydrolase